MSFLLSFGSAALDPRGSVPILRLSVASNPRRSVSVQSGRIIQGGRSQISFEEAPQIIRARVQAQFNRAPIDCGFHFGWTTERKAYVDAVGGLLLGHRQIKYY
jgi:hypothetical protein